MSMMIWILSKVIHKHYQINDPKPNINLSDDEDGDWILNKGVVLIGQHDAINKDHQIHHNNISFNDKIDNNVYKVK